MLDLVKLRQLAEAASKTWSGGSSERVSFDEFDKDEPGTFTSMGPTLRCPKDQFWELQGDDCRRQMHKNTQFILACSPAVILELLSRIDIHSTNSAKDSPNG